MNKKERRYFQGILQYIQIEKLDWPELKKMLWAFALHEYSRLDGLFIIAKEKQLKLDAEDDL